MAVVRMFVSNKRVSAWLIRHRSEMARVTFTGNNDQHAGSVTWGAHSAFATYTSTNALSTLMTYPTWKEIHDQLGWAGSPERWLSWR